MRNRFYNRHSFPFGHPTSTPKATLDANFAALAIHMLLMGGSGTGKSKFEQHLALSIMQKGVGCTVVDPHGDLCEDLLEYIYVNPSQMLPQFVRDKVIYFQPGDPYCALSFDLFDQWEGEYFGTAYQKFVEATANSYLQQAQRMQGNDDLAGMARFARWGFNTIVSAGISVDDKGTHLGVENALVVIDAFHPDHNAVFERVAPALHRHGFAQVLADLNKIRSMKRASDSERLTESTFNRLRAVFDRPALRAMLGGHRRSLNVADYYRRGYTILLDLRQSTSFTRTDAVAVSGAFQLAEDRYCRTVLPHERVARVNLIDEAEHFLDKSTMDLLGEGRKFKRAIIASVQDGTCLHDRDHDYLAKFLSQCGIVVSFQQKYHRDLDTLADFFGVPNLNFEQLNHEVDRPVQQLRMIPTVSFGRGIGNGFTHSKGRTLSTSVTQAANSSLAKGNSNTIGTNSSITNGESLAKGETHSFANSNSVADSETDNWSETKSETKSKAFGSTNSWSHAESDSSSTTTSSTDTWGRSSGHQSSTGSSTGEQWGQSQGASQSMQIGGLTPTISNSMGGSFGGSESSTSSEGKSSSESQGGSRSNGETTGHSHTDTSGGSRSVTSTTGTGQAFSKGGSRGRTLTRGETESNGTSLTIGKSSTEGFGKSLSNGTSLTGTVGRSFGQTLGAADSVQVGVSEQANQSLNASYSLQLLTTYLRETQPTGRLLQSVQDQIAAIRQLLATLPPMHMIVRQNRTKSFLLRTVEVRDPYELAGNRIDLCRTPAMRRASLQAFRKKLFERCPSMFNPEDVACSSLARFLRVPIADPSLVDQAEESIEGLIG